MTLPGTSSTDSAASLNAENPHRFSIRHYSKTLRTYLSAGYEVVPFRDLPKVRSPKVMILRHDIDISPELAGAMLAAEKRLGVRSTVFVRTSAPGYDLADSATARLVSQIQRDGFEVGLHYDISDDGERGLTSLLKQKRDLERCLGDRVRGAAPHRIATVGKQVPPDWLEQAGLTYDAFQPEFRTEFKYLSDSRRRWREGCFCRWTGKAERLHVLVHPVWWRRGSLARMPGILSQL